MSSELRVTSQDGSSSTTELTTSNYRLSKATGFDVSIHADRSDIASMQRSGENLIITLENGDKITLVNFFAELDDGTRHRLFFSDDGAISQIALEGTVQPIEVADTLIFRWRWIGRTWRCWCFGGSCWRRWRQ